jgi:hypothetical protein
VNALKLARDLAHFEGYLEGLARQSGCCADHCPAAALAESWLHLLDRLTELDGGEAVVPIVAQAIVIHNGVRVTAQRNREARRQQAEADYAEAVRRHKIAITADCPYCGAAPGSMCRTAGPSGIGNPKGVHDHADRYRAGEHLLGQEE